MPCLYRMQTVPSRLFLGSLRVHLCGACWQSGGSPRCVTDTMLPVVGAVLQHTHVGSGWLRAQLSCGWEPVTVASALCPAPVTMWKVAAVDHLGQLQEKHRCSETLQPPCSPSLRVIATVSSSYSLLLTQRAAARRNCLFKLFWIPGHVPEKGAI